MAIPLLNKELTFRRWDGLPLQLCRVGNKRNQYSVWNRLPGLLFYLVWGTNAARCSQTPTQPGQQVTTAVPSRRPALTGFRHAYSPAFCLAPGGNDCPGCQPGGGFCGALCRLMAGTGLPGHGTLNRRQRGPQVKDCCHCSWRVVFGLPAYVDADLRAV